MADKLVDLLREITDNYYVIIFLLSMIPLIELKGAIPIGAKLFGAQFVGAPFFQTALFAYLGSTLICIPIFFLMIPIFGLLKKIPFVKKVIEKIEAMFRKRAEKIANKASDSTEKKARHIMMLSLFVFVAVPFPVTGIWTGTAIAVFLGMRFRDSILPLAVGNLVAGSLITLLTWFFQDYVNIILYVLFAIVVVMIVITIVKIAMSKPKTDSNTEKSE